jgi:Spy/CpxP family protein refolding chaperone
MNKMARKKACVALLLLIPAFTVVTQASIAGPAIGALIDKDFESAMRKFVTRRFFNRIDASEDQRAKLSAIIEKNMDESRPDREQFRQGVLDLSNLMASAEATDEQIKEKAGEVRSMKQKLADRRLSAALEVRKVLTVAQRQKINSRVQDFITGGAKPLRKISFLMDE